MVELVGNPLAWTDSIGFAKAESDGLGARGISERNKMIFFTDSSFTT